jgi:type I restriction enzyme, S subunit
MKIGEIPDGWLIMKLSDISSMKSGATITSKSISESDIYPCYGGNGLRGFTSGYTHDGDYALIGRQGALCGNVQFVSDKFFASEHAVVVTPKKPIDIVWLYHVLNDMNLNQYSESSAQPGLSVIKLLNLTVILPTKSEQTAIATALSDTDTLIENLEKLIQKKRNIKQGTMQELLTGRKRLTGFHRKWETKKLREIGEIAGSGVDKKTRPEEVPVRLVNYLDVYHRDFIYSNELYHWVTAPIAQAKRCEVKVGDIFFTPSSEMRYDIAISAIAMENITDAVYSYHLVRLRLFEDWDLPFRAYIFKTKDFIDQAETICEGSGKRYVISLSKFREMEIRYPSDKSEQIAISKILYDSDSELNLLEQKLYKYRMIKQGMIQVLLTGKIRLS